jgi:3-oxoacyl-[acyl-carrier protein] reductase
MSLASDSKHVVCSARTESALDELVSEITASGGSAEKATCDVSDGDAVHELVEGVHDKHGRLDILVNNAGITRDGLIMRMPDEHFDEILQVNLRSAFVACRAAARPMMRGRFGRIINIGSVSGLVGNPGQSNYAASKAALVGLSKSLAKELGAKGITVNVVAPGFIQTDMTQALDEEMMSEVASRIPARRLGQPEEIANAVSWLASDEAGYVTGQVLVVDGGLAM